VGELKSRSCSAPALKLLEGQRFPTGWEISQQRACPYTISAQPRDPEKLACDDENQYSAREIVLVFNLPNVSSQTLRI